MYLKYVVNSTPAATVAGVSNVYWEISDILMGIKTDMSTCTYGTATKDGTSPTAGTYTRTLSSQNTGHSYVEFSKKHCQWHTSNYPAVCTFKIGNPVGVLNCSFNWYDKDGANGTNHTSYMGNNSTWNTWYPYANTAEHHFIINDTTFVYCAVEAQQGNPASRRYFTTYFSDFEKTAYDEYAIASNAKYYGGAMYTGICKKPSDAYFNETANQMSVYRFQYQRQHDGAFANSTLEDSYSSNDSYYGANDASGSTLIASLDGPKPYQRMHKTWGSGGHSIAMNPVIFDGYGQQTTNYSYGPTNSYNAQDARLFSPMLNTYRCTDSIGSIGDIIQEADNTQYYIFWGHRVGTGSNDNMASQTYHPTIWAFPKNNVPIS